MCALQAPAASAPATAQPLSFPAHRRNPAPIAFPSSGGRIRLVIIGVHTPEFAFEKSASNVQTALKRNNIEYPVAQDNNSAGWNAYNNHYWPAQYVIDQ